MDDFARRNMTTGGINNCPFCSFCAQVDETKTEKQKQAKQRCTKSTHPSRTYRYRRIHTHTGRSAPGGTALTREGTEAENVHEVTLEKAGCDRACPTPTQQQWAAWRRKQAERGPSSRAQAGRLATFLVVMTGVLLLRPIFDFFFRFESFEKEEGCDRCGLNKARGLSGVGPGD